MTELVIAEAFYALRHHYGVPDTVALGRLREFLGSPVDIIRPVPGKPWARERGDRQAS